MLGVINLLRRQLGVFLHVWGILSFQVKDYEEREEHFGQADEDIKGMVRGGKESLPLPLSPLNPLLARSSFPHFAGTALEAL